MAELAEILNMTGPAYTGSTGGARDAITNATSLQNLMTNAQAYDKAEQMNPLDVEFRRGQVEDQGLKNRKTRETIDTDIEKENVANKSAILKSRVEDTRQMGAMTGLFGAQLSQIPAGLPRQVVARDLMKQNGIDEESQLGQYIMNAEPSKLMDLSKEFSKLTNQYVLEMSKEESQRKGQLAVAVQQGKNSATVEEMGIKAGKYNKTGKWSLSLEQKIDSENEPAKKMALLLDAAKQAQAAGETDLAQSYIARAGQLENLARLRASQANPQAGKLDTGAVTGLPTQPVPPVMPPQNQPTPAPMVAPNGAIQMLRSNPALAPQFDAKYGPGSAARILGNR